MWGIDPCAGASQTRRLTGIPEELIGFAIDTVLSVRSALPLELVSASFY